MRYVTTIPDDVVLGVLRRVPSEFARELAAVPAEAPKVVTLLSSMYDALVSADDVQVVSPTDRSFICVLERSATAELLAALSTLLQAARSCAA